MGSVMSPTPRRMTRWPVVREPLIAQLNLRSLLMPDDWSYAGMLTAWIVLVTVATYLLRGWASAAAFITVAGLFGLGTLAIQSRPPRRPERGIADGMQRAR